MAITNDGRDTEHSIRTDYDQLGATKQRAIDLQITLTDDEVIKQVAEDAGINVDVVYNVRSNYKHAIKQRREQLREQIADSDYTSPSKSEHEQLAETIERLAELRSVEGYEMDYEEAFDAILTAYEGDSL